MAGFGDPALHPAIKTRGCLGCRHLLTSCGKYASRERVPQGRQRRRTSRTQTGFRLYREPAYVEHRADLMVSLRAQLPSKSAPSNAAPSYSIHLTVADSSCRPSHAQEKFRTPFPSVGEVPPQGKGRRFLRPLFCQTFSRLRDARAGHDRADVSAAGARGPATRAGGNFRRRDSRRAIPRRPYAVLSRHHHAGQPDAVKVAARLCG